MNLSDRISSASPANPYAGHSPGHELPIGGYAVLMSTFLSSAAAFGTWFHRSGRELPDSISAPDLALLAVASHKAARLIPRARVTTGVRAPFTRYQDDAGRGEVDEGARGHGLRRAIGELLVCPYCIGMWISAAMTGSLLVFPRFTRWVAGVLVIFFGSELLQIAYVRAEKLIED